MSNINIGRDNADSSFRYKMPKLQTKVEGRGNGIKTVLVNIQDIAKALHVLPHYPTKYFGIELGAQSKFDKAREMGVVNGAHNAGDLAKLLDKYIGTFVLCPTCKLPEIKMDAQKSKIKIDCAACGHNSILKTAHKLATYILKNPPDVLVGKAPKKGDKDEEEEPDVAAGDAKLKKKDKKEKKEKGEKKTAKAKKGKKSAADEEENGDDEENGAAVTDEAEEEGGATGDSKNGEEKKPKVVAVKKKEEGEETAVEWFSDASKEAIRKRQEEEFAEMKTMDDAKRKSVVEIVNSAKAAGKSESPVSFMRIYLASGEHSVDDIMAELKRLQISRGFDDHERVKVLIDAILDSSQPATILEQLAKHFALLKTLGRDRQAQKLLLGGLEDFIGNASPKLIVRVPHILTTLYEADVLDEESIVGWAESPPESSWQVKKETAMLIRKKAKPFVEWLKNAEEDDE